MSEDTCGPNIMTRFPRYPLEMLDGKIVSKMNDQIIHNCEPLIPEHNHESIEVRIRCEEDGQVPEVK